MGYEMCGVRSSSIESVVPIFVFYFRRRLQ